MKKLILITSILVSQPLMAAQCRVDIKNEIHLDESQVEIHQASGGTAIMDNANNLYIHGEKIELDSDQQAAIEQYRESMNAYLPKAKQMANEGLALANDVIDDIAKSLDSPDAFDNVKASMKQFYADLEARYYKDGDLILPAESFDSMANSWSEDFDKAMEIFNEEFITSAFNAMSEKMNQEGGLNLTEMANSMTEIKDQLAKRLQEHSKKVEQQTEEFCDSLDEMAEQEQQLHKKIPELKDYQTFTI